MKLFPTLIIALLTAGAADASDEQINTKFRLKDLDRAFEMAAAELKMTTVIYENGCGEKTPAWCSFHGEGAQEIRGLAPTIDSPPTNISIIYKPDGNPVPFARNIGLLVSICEVAMKQNERGKIIADIIQVTGGKKDGPVIGGKSCNYSVSKLLGQITVVAERAKH